MPISEKKIEGGTQDGVLFGHLHGTSDTFDLASLQRLGKAIYQVFAAEAASHRVSVPAASHHPCVAMCANRIFHGCNGSPG